MRSNIALCNSVSRVNVVLSFSKATQDSVILNTSHLIYWQSGSVCNFLEIQLPVRCWPFECHLQRQVVRYNQTRALTRDEVKLVSGG